ncbi:hypothetical protein GGX14DRAFT_457750 [Mycena pura]|uniref:Extracellular membrane protein CFEM domain-containing protein n=1 Tax=Mycena pura TaxID=153505 RepID=A0AAD6VCE0_9AGAR|nr:hypothetical protein GGX14DRAFT_457750 [Mycena pura]
MTAAPPRCSILGRRGRCGPFLAFFLFYLASLVAPVAAQLRIGNLTHVLPQCQTVCDAYDVMTTECNGVGVFEITFIYCECTPQNLQIVERCFDCQSVNASQQALMQNLLDDIVNTCNDKNGAPDSTLSVSPQFIVPSSSASSASGSLHKSISDLSLRCAGGVVGVAIATAGAVFFW